MLSLMLLKLAVARLRVKAGMLAYEGAFTTLDSSSLKECSDEVSELLKGIVTLEATITHPVRLQDAPDKPKTDGTVSVTVPEGE